MSLIIVWGIIIRVIDVGGEEYVGVGSVREEGVRGVGQFR
jgi:hypothetical protein